MIQVFYGGDYNLYLKLLMLWVFQMIQVTVRVDLSKYLKLLIL
jgi:hypothetical protein